MKPLNPFIWDRPIPPGRFVGRKKEVGIILDQLANPYNRGSVAITGPNGIGKSSLLSYLASEEAGAAWSESVNLETVHFAMIDCRTVAQSGEAGFWRYVLRSLERILPGQLGTEAGKLVEEKEYTPFDLGLFFDYVAEDGRVAVLLLDTFEAIVEAVDPRAPTLLYNLRHLINQPRRGLAVVTASVRRTSDLLRRLTWSGSPFDNQFALIQLKPFERTTVYQLIDHYLADSAITFNDQDRRFIWEQAQGYPQRTQRACHLLFERYVEKGASQE
jgi:ATP/maltotriose-dependent transcriptional regulator MalT